MAPSIRLIVPRILLALLIAPLSFGQKCYFPNGDLTKDDGPCSPEIGSPCCPLNWQCLSNGLCYLPSEDYYGRYTCADQTWGSSDCPNFCTQDGTATGNEAILKCSNGKYCCDGNRSFDCCTMRNAVFFDLPEGKVVATIDQAAMDRTRSPGAEATGESTTSSSRKVTASSDAERLPSASGAVRTRTFSSVITSGSGTAITIVSTETLIGAAASSTSQPDRSASNSSKRTSIGVSVGVVLGVILISALIFFIVLRYRGNKKRFSNINQADDHSPIKPSDNGAYAGGLSPSTVDAKFRPMSELSSSPALGTKENAAELPPEPHPPIGPPTAPHAHMGNNMRPAPSGSPAPSSLSPMTQDRFSAGAGGVRDDVSSFRQSAANSLAVAYSPTTQGSMQVQAQQEVVGGQQQQQQQQQYGQPQVSPVSPQYPQSAYHDTLTEMYRYQPSTQWAGSDSAYQAYQPSQPLYELDAGGDEVPVAQRGQTG